jgi:hypothetical protein
LFLTHPGNKSSISFWVTFTFDVFKKLLTPFTKLSFSHHQSSIGNGVMVSHNSRIGLGGSVPSAVEQHICIITLVIIKHQPAS